MQEEQKKVTKGNGQTRTFRYHLKRTDWLQLTGCPSQKEKLKFVQSL